MQIVNEKIDLFDNYTNYLYKVENYENIIENEQDTYILFNPSIHYWIALDNIGHTIYTEIHNNCNMGIVKENLINKFSIDETIFTEDVLPFVEDLLKNGFLSTTKTEAEASWMDVSFNVDAIETYPFGDLYVSLTDKCNLNCIYCFNKKERHHRISEKSGKTISKEKIIETLKEFKALKGSKVVFTGGEPMLNDDLIEICYEAKQLGLEPHFITNGTLLNTIDIEKLSQCVDSFTISLDSVVQKELEVLWGNQDVNIENSIFSALEKIDAFSLAHKRMTIFIKPIVSTVNINSLDTLVSVITEKLKNCEVFWAMTQFDKIDDKNTDDLLSITEDDYIKSVSKSLRSTYLNENNNYSDTVDEAKKISNRINVFSFGHGGRFVPSKSPNLLTCNPSFFLTSNGDVFPCQCFDNEDYKLGNINDTSLSDLFENDIFKKIRSKLPVPQIDDKTCIKCEFRYICSNRLGPCAVNKEKDKTNCKQTNIRKLFLQTQLGL